MSAINKIREAKETVRGTIILLLKHLTQNWIRIPRQCKYKVSSMKSVLKLWKNKQNVDNPLQIIVKFVRRWTNKS